MDVLILNKDHFLVCCGCALLIEFLHLLIAHLFLGPTRQIEKWQRDLVTAETKLKGIKSVQLQLVENSLLERKKNDAEMKLEKMKEASIPRAALVVQLLNLVKVFTYIYISIYYEFTNTMVVSSDIIYGLPFLSGGLSLYLDDWQVIFMSALMCRYLLRAVLPALLPSFTIP